MADAEKNDAKVRAAMIKLVLNVSKAARPAKTYTSFTDAQSDFGNPA